MSAIPEPIISEKEPLEIVNDTLAKKTKIIKRKSPKSTNTLRNLGSLKTSSLGNTSGIVSDAPDTSLEGILAGNNESELPITKKQVKVINDKKKTACDVPIDVPIDVPVVASEPNVEDLEILELDGIDYYKDIKNNNVYQLVNGDDIGLFLGVYDTVNNTIIKSVASVASVANVVKKKTVSITKRKSPKQSTKTGTTFDAIINSGEVETVQSDESSKKDDSKKAEPKEKAKPVRGAKKIKHAEDASYLRLPEKDSVIDFYDKEHQNTQEQAKKDKVNEVKTAIAKIHQILWETQQMKPDTALNEVMNLMFLKYLGIFASETTDNNKIDLLNRKYYKDSIDNADLDACFPYIKDFSLMYKEMNDINKNKGDKTKLEEYRSSGGAVDYIKKITEILKTHHITGKLFGQSISDVLKIRNPETLLDVLEVLERKCFSSDNNIEDLIGEIYEYFVNDYMKSKSALGQYFTPRTLMDITLKLKHDAIIKIIKKFKDEPELIVSDKTMGTAGWLVKFYNNFKANHSNILLHGCEVEPSTYNYGLINILTTSGKFPKEPICDSSLTVVPNIKQHFGTSNPPFSAGLTYETLRKEYNANAERFRKMEKDGIMTYKGYNTAKFEDIYFLKDENSTPLQIMQVYIYSLVEGGMCFIVIPYGELFYKDGLALNGVRKLLLDKINITDIIVCPGALFTYTDTKVCMLIFEKCSTGTKAIRFGRYDFNTSDTKDKKRFLKYYRHYSTVSKEDILKEPIQSMYHMDYLHDEHAQTLIDSGKIKECEWVAFGDVFDLIKGELQSSKVVEDENGDGVFITGANETSWKKILNWKYEGEYVFISNVGRGVGRTEELPIRYYNGKFDNNDLMLRFQIKTEYITKINIKYIYYYIKSIKNNTEINYQKGSCNQSLDIKNFNRMKIPIPSLDVQRAYVKLINDAVGKSLELSNFNPNLQKLSYIETLSNTIKNSDVKELFELALKKQIKLPTTQWVAFGDVFDLVKGELQSSKVEEDENGDGVLINLSIYNNFKRINNPELNGENLFISTTMSSGDKDYYYNVITFYNGKCSYCNTMFRVLIKEKYTNKINLKFISMYLNNNKDYIDFTYERGSNNKSLDIKNFNRMKIPIPPIEAQNEIVAEINEVDAIAERWKRDIEYLKNKKGNRMLDIINLDKPE